MNQIVSEQFGRSFRSFGDAQGHDSTALEGDFLGERAVFRQFRGGDLVGAVTFGLDPADEDELKEEIRAGAASIA